MITLTQLEYVVAVGRLGSFSQAAKACFVTQPTLSMQVRKLEDELGVQIFDRSAQPVRSTPIGREILAQGAVVLAHAARIGALVDEAKEQLEGELRLGVIPTVAPYVLPLFLDRFCTAHPRVHLRVDEMKTDDILATLRSYDLDVGLLATPLHEDHIEEHPLFLEPFHVYIGKKSPLCRLDEIDDADLKGERVLLLTEGHCLRTQVVRACSLRLRKRKRSGGGFDFEGGSLETLCRLVDQGLGYTVIPHLARTSVATRDGRAIPFTDPQPSREVSLCVHASFARHALLEALAASIRAALPPELRRTDAPRKRIKLT